tara:strand:- start:728 stop:1159 length:432 start_codon:yes stop_codon:yes gene_type:complete
MFSQFFTRVYKKLSFEDIQFAIRNRGEFVIINTLPVTDQSCLIENTISHVEEEQILNNLLTNYGLNQKIIVYGRNNTDNTINTKYDQLMNLGFQTVYLYVGGMFEWLCLQDIYGKEEFPTTTRELDILKYKPPRTFGGYLLTR